MRNLNNLGVKELTKKELKETEGGFLFVLGVVIGLIIGFNIGK